MVSFRATVISFKFISILVLVLIALAARHDKYIRATPHKFVADTLLIGGTTAAAFCVVLILRDRCDLVPMTGLAIFITFATYAAARELAGFNGLQQLEDRGACVMTAVKWPFAVLNATLVAIVTFAALQVGIPHPHSVTMLLAEACFLGLVAGLVEAVVAKNHGKGMLLVGILTGLAVVVGHVVLQLGGAYA